MKNDKQLSMESSNAENISSALENVTELLVLYWLPKTEDS